MDESTLQALEFPALVERLAGATATPYGEELARALVPSADIDEVARRQALTADVFLAAIQAAGSYSGGRGAPIAWLYGIARNVVANEWRHRAGESRTLRRISGRELVADADLAGLHERIDAESAGRRLHAELGRLSERDRAVLELVALDDLTVSEAAHALGITAVTARVRLHRARRALQARLPEPNLGIDERAEVIS